MERMEQKTPVARTFVARIQQQAAEILLHIRESLSEIKEGAVEMPMNMKEVREGNPSDKLRVELRAEAFAAKQYLEELSSVENVSREEYHRLQVLAKLVEFYEAQENYFTRLAEAKDDPDLTELFAVMLAEIQKNYAKCMEEFSSDSQAE